MDQVLITYAQVSNESFVVKTVKCLTKDMYTIMQNLEKYFDSIIIDVAEWIRPTKPKYAKMKCRSRGRSYQSHKR